MLTIRKPFGICFSTRATLACSTRIDGQEPSPGAFGLVEKFLKECRPSCIVHRFSQLATGQTFYVQVLQSRLARRWRRWNAIPRPAMPAKPGGFPRLLRPEQPDLETKDWKEVLWSPSHFAAGCGRTRYSRSILGRRKPRFNLSTWLAGALYPRPQGRAFTPPRIKGFVDVLTFSVVAARAPRLPAG